MSAEPVSEATERHAAQAREGAPRRLWPLLLAALLAFLILIGLGTWQIERLSWKEALIATVAARMAADPVPVPPAAAWPRLTPQTDEYRRVTARGTFDHGREVAIYTVLGDQKGPLSGPGYLIITPLMRADGPPILVNRGFVPLDKRDPKTRAAGQVQGEVTVTGPLRFSEEASLFVPANDPARDAWYRREPAEIARAKGLPDAAPFLIDADATANPGGLPQGGETRVTFPNRHLEYALTWYGLAATLVLVVGALVLSRRRARRDTEG